MVQVMIDRIESCKSVRILGEMDMDDGQIEGVKRRHVPTFSAMGVLARQSNGLELNLALLPTLMAWRDICLLHGTSASTRRICYGSCPLWASHGNIDATESMASIA